MSATTNIHSFHILAREISPVGNKTTTTIRKNRSRGESKPGTTTIKNINPETGLVAEEKIEQNKVQFHPGDMEEEIIQGATIRWTMNHSGKDHVVVDVITYKELSLLNHIADGAVAYNNLRAAIYHDSDKNSIITAILEIDDFKLLLSPKINHPSSPLSHFKDLVYLPTYTGTGLEDVVTTYAGGNLPSGVTL